MFRFGFLSALGFALAVFLSLSACSRWLSVGFADISISSSRCSRFHANVYALCLSDVALCAFGRSVLPLAVLCSFLPCSRCCRGFGFRSVAVRWSVTALFIGFIPFAPCQAWIDWFTLSGWSLRLGGRWALYLCSVCPLGHLAQPLDMSQCSRGSIPFFPRSLSVGVADL